MAHEGSLMFESMTSGLKQLCKWKNPCLIFVLEHVQNLSEKNHSFVDLPRISSPKKNSQKTCEKIFELKKRGRCWNRQEKQ